MDKFLKRKIVVVLILLTVGLVLFVPVVPVEVVPEVNLKVVDPEGKPKANTSILQSWGHPNYGSDAIENEEVSNSEGLVTFSEKNISVSIGGFVLTAILASTIGGLAIHSSSGPYNYFFSKDYNSESKWCFPEAGCRNRESPKVIVVKERKKLLRVM